MNMYRVLMAVCAVTVTASLIAGALCDTRWLLAGAAGIMAAFVIETEYEREE